MSLLEYDSDMSIAYIDIDIIIVDMLSFFYDLREYKWYRHDRDRTLLER